MIMVTLQHNNVATDRKIFPIDIYSATMALGLFDLTKFCKDYIMPCLEIKERKDQTLKLKIHEKEMLDLIAKCEQKTESDF